MRRNRDAEEPGGDEPSEDHPGPAGGRHLVRRRRGGRFLDKIDSGTEGDVVDYACRVCGTRYRATWYAYGAFAQGYSYELSSLNVAEEGAPVVRPVPFLRFRTGYEMRDQSRFREVEDVDEVLEYLARLAGEEESPPLLERLRRWIGD